MKRTHIDRIIKSKITDWLSTITDPNVVRLARDNTIVMGGCIASMLLNEKINDFDIYFRTKEAAMAVAIYYLKPKNIFVLDMDDRLIIKASPTEFDEAGTVVLIDSSQIETLREARRRGTLYNLRQGQAQISSSLC
jgi:hypothetical protein